MPKEVAFYLLKTILIDKLPVVWFISPYMGKTVNTPSEVKTKAISD